MSNTGNTQQIIDYGATANDGTGDPLRTAFIKTDENFSNIWAAGPVGSNITIANNTIQNDSTNGNIILKPNGTGVIQANASILPGIDGVRDLGSNVRAWRRAYINIANIAELSVQSTLDVAGDAVVQGNLTVEGDTIQIGNTTTDTLLIQLANAAANGAQADGAGVTVGADDDIATILYDSTSNTWTTNIGISAAGNVTSPYFIGNGSQLTGMYGNANVVANLAALSSNPISTTGNVTAGYFLGNGSQLTGIAASYGNANVVANLAALGSNPISTTGNVTANYFIGNGSLLTGITSYANANAVALGESGWAGNIIPAANAVYSLGNSTMYWSNLWVANNTIYIGGVALGITAGNVLTVGGNAVLQNNSNSTISTTGNITAGNINITGGSLTWANASIVQTSAADVSITGDGQVTVRSLDGTYQWTFDDAGNLTAPGNVTAGYFFGNIQGAVGNITSLDSLNFTVENISALIGNNGVNIGAGGYNNLVVLPTEVLIQNVPLTVAGNIVANQANGLYITANTVANGTAQIWNFDTTGDLTVPGNIISTVATGLTIGSSYSVYIVGDQGDNNRTWTFDGTSGDTQLPNGTVIADDDNNTQIRVPAAIPGTWKEWTFGVDGELTLPTGEGVIKALDDTINLVSLNTTSGNANSVYLGSGGGLGFNDQEIGGNWLEIFRSGTEPEIRVPVGLGNLNIQTAEGANAYNWTFDNTGNLTLPTDGYLVVTTGIVGSDASPAPSLSGFSSIATTGSPGNISASGNLLISGYANITGNINGSNAQFSGNVTGNFFGGNGSQLTDVNAVTVDITDTNGLVTTYYPTFVENRTTGQIARADVDLTYRTDDNLLTVGNISVTGNITGNTAGFAIGYRDIPQVSFTANATIAAADAGKHFYSTLATANTLTIANNTSVGWSVGTAITIVNRGTGNMTIAQGTGVSLYLAGNSSAGNRTVTTYGMATLLNVAANVWMINGTGVS